MDVSVTPELERFVAEKVASLGRHPGHYSSASEVVLEALRLLEERDRLQSDIEVERWLGEEVAPVYDRMQASPERRRRSLRRRSSARFAVAMRNVESTPLECSGRLQP